MVPDRYFGSGTFSFLQELKANNEKGWFEANRSRYGDHVKGPALTLIQDMGPRLAKLSPHFHAGPRSLFRIHRDVRFSRDKSPYKTSVGVQFRHDAGKDAHAPGFYFHVEPGNSFLGLGMWHPDGSAIRKVRELIIEMPDDWRSAVGRRGFRDAFELQGDRLSRPPRGFDPEHPLIEALKWKDYIGVRSVTHSFVTDPKLPDALVRLFRAGTPFMRFLCRAVGVPF